jgi:hypothetical protein
LSAVSVVESIVFDSTLTAMASALSRVISSGLSSDCFRIEMAAWLR